MTFMNASGVGEASSIREGHSYFTMMATYQKHVSFL